MVDDGYSCGNGGFGHDAGVEPRDGAGEKDEVLRVDGTPRSGQTAPRMKPLLALVALLAAALSAAAGDRVVLYAMLTESQRVELTDGARWQMDKGDCFPVVAYKESHTKVILQLAGAQFMVPAQTTRIVSEKELPKALASYRANVNTYINSFTNRWRSNAESGKKSE